MARWEPMRTRLSFEDPKVRIYLGEELERVPATFPFA